MGGTKKRPVAQNSGCAEACELVRMLVSRAAPSGVLEVDAAELRRCERWEVRARSVPGGVLRLELVEVGRLSGGPGASC